MMEDPLATERAIVKALKLTAPPPQAWVDAAALLPTTLGDLARLESAVNSPEFRRQFAEDPHAALTAAGLPASTELVAAMRDRLSE